MSIFTSARCSGIQFAAHLQPLALNTLVSYLFIPRTLQESRCKGMVYSTVRLRHDKMIRKHLDNTQIKKKKIHSLDQPKQLEFQLKIDTNLDLSNYIPTHISMCFFSLLKIIYKFFMHKFFFYICTSFSI